MTTPYKLNKITALASTASSYQDSLKVYKTGMLPFGKTDDSSSGGGGYTGPTLPRAPLEVYGLISPEQGSEVTVKHSPNSPLSVKNLTSVNTPALVEVVIAPAASSDIVVKHSPNRPSDVESISDPASSGLPVVKHSPNGVTSIAIESTPISSSNPNVKYSPGSVLDIDTLFSPNRVALIELEASPFSVSIVDYGYIPNELGSVSVEISPASVAEVSYLSNPAAPTIIDIKSSPRSVSQVNTVSSPTEFDENILVEHNPNTPVSISGVQGPARLSSVDVYHSPNPPEILIEYTPNSPSVVGGRNKPFEVLEVSAVVSSAGVSDINIEYSPNGVTSLTSVQIDANQVDQILVEHSPNSPVSIEQDSEPLTVFEVSTGILPEEVSLVSLSKSPQSVSEVSLSRSPETPSLSIESSPNSVSECLSGIDPVPTDDYIDVQHSPNKPSSVITEADPNIVSDLIIQHNPNNLSSTDIDHTPNNPVSIIIEYEVYEPSDIEVQYSPNGLSSVGIDKTPCQPCDVEAQHEPNAVAYVSLGGQPNIIDTIAIDYQPNSVSEVGYGYTPSEVDTVSAGFLYTEAPSDLSDVSIAHNPNSVSSVSSIDATLPDEVSEVSVLKSPDSLDSVLVDNSPNQVSTVSLVGEDVPDDVDFISVTHSANTVSSVSTIATPNKVSTVEVKKQDLDSDGVPDDEEYFVYESSTTYTKEQLDSFELSYATFDLTGGDIIKWIAPNDGILTTGEYYFVMTSGSVSAVVESGPVNPATNTPYSKTIFYTDKGTKFLKVHKGVVATAPNDPLSPIVDSSPYAPLSNIGIEISPNQVSSTTVDYQPNQPSTVTSVDLDLWTPSEISTVAWYDPSEGDSSTSYLDKSGNNYNLSQVTNNRILAPVNTRTFNGLGVYEFGSGTQTTYVLENDSFNYNLATSDLVMSLIIRIDDNDTALTANHADFIFEFYDGASTSTAYRTFCRRLSSDTLQVLGGTGTGAASFYSASGAFSHGNDYLLTFVLRGDNSSIRIQGAVSNTGTMGQTVLNSINLGHNMVEGQSIHGFIGEVVFHNSLADIEKVEGYLAHKWGLDSSLDSGHTYKVFPPSIT